MSDPQAPPLNPGAILKALLGHGVEFVVVGGIASTGHGSARFTKDLDICPAWNDANLAKVTAALRALGAQMKTDHARGMGTQPSVRMLRKMEITTWRTPDGDVDVLLGIPKAKNWQLAQYRQLNENAVLLDLGDHQVLIASLEDIIRSKEIANRPADHAALPELRELLARQPTGPPQRSPLPNDRSPKPPPPPYGTEARRDGPTGPTNGGCER